MSNFAARFFPHKANTQARASPARPGAIPGQASGSSTLSEILESMPAQKNCAFTDQAGREAVGAMYTSLFGPDKDAFPGSQAVLRYAQGSSDAKHQFLSEAQESLLPKESNQRRAVSCGRIFKKGECCFRCKDCAQDDSCVLCSTCFNATAHVHANHNVSFFIAQQSGGCCDCGDSEAWRIDIDCPYHAMREFPFDWNNESLHPSVNAISSQYLTPAMRSRISSTFATLLDYILCTLDDSPTEPNAPADMGDLYSQSSGLPESGDIFSLVLWNDDKHSFEEVIGLLCDLGREPGVSASSSQFSFAISSSTPPAVASPVTIIPGSGVLLRTRAEATKLTRTIDEVGRATIGMSYPPPSRRTLGPDSPHLNGGLAKGHPPTPEDLLSIAHRISQIDLGVTLRRAYDVFREDLVGCIVQFLVDACSAAVNLPELHGEGEDTGTNASHPQRVLRELLAEEMFAKRIGGKMYKDTNRIDLLFVYHTKLWKKARLGMKEVYAAIGTLGPRWKARVASHFAYSYPHVLSSYLLIDREAETSIKYFALQVFTVPSIAHLVVQKHHLITRLLGVIVAFFGGKTSFEGGQLTLFDTSRLDGGPTFAGIETATHVLESDSQPFKSKRFMPIFSDLRYLAHNEPVKRMIATSPTSEVMISEFAKTCQLFTAVNPNRRMKKEHIEFESDSWISVFNVSLSLARVVRVYGDSWSISANRGNVRELVRAIEIVTTAILEVIVRSSVKGTNAKMDEVVFHWVQIGPESERWKIVQYEVGGEQGKGVSFHHSLHWLLAELFKHVDMLSPEILRKEVGVPDGLRSVMSNIASDDALLTVVDIPLRVLAMIAQIRCGLWVRNGFAIRGQLLHYRDFMLRELCYDQDLFIIQSAFCFLPCDILLVSIMDRFNLLAFFSGSDEAHSSGHEAYEGPHLFGMVEELLYVLMTAVSEPCSAGRWSTERQIRREVIHALVFGPAAYTDLVKRVAERLVDDVAFERVLKQVAHFKPPEGTHDTGVYELKEECFDEVSPWYFHYARNKREEVETLLSERNARRNGKKSTTGQNGPKSQEVLYIPRPWSEGMERDGPFKETIPRVMESRIFVQILFYSIWHCVAAVGPGSSSGGEDAVVDTTLQLIMIALVNCGEVFARLAAEIPFSIGVAQHDTKTILDLLCSVETQESWKGWRLRVGWILDQLTVHTPTVVRAKRTIPDTDVGDAKLSEAEKKKAAAKKRQEAIMARMKKQQDMMVSQIEDPFEDPDGDEVMQDGTGTAAPEGEVSYGTCIVCQEDLTSAKAFGTLGMVQPSRFVRRHPDGQHSYLNEVLNSPDSLDRAITVDLPPTFPPTPEKLQEARTQGTFTFDGFSPQHTRFGLQGSVCSHMMHLECFSIYSFSVRQRHRSQATRNHPESIPRKEYICPLCKSLGNVILPVLRVLPTAPTLNTTPFPDWIRAAGIGILKSKPDPLLESLQFRNGTGEFVFWSAQDSGYAPLMKAATDSGHTTQDTLKMVDTVMVVAKSISQQTRHLRDRPEPDPGERGAGLYLPEELAGYTIAALEIAQRGISAPEGGLLVDNLSEAQIRLVHGLVASLTKLVGLHFKGRPDEGRDAVRQAIIKRLLPEWSRTSLTSFSYPLLLRDPFSVLVETAAVAPDMLRHVLILTYYACVARTVIGLVFILNKTRSYSAAPINRRSHENVLGDVRMFFMSVVRHSPVFEHTATLVFETFGEARIEKLMYSFTLPFLRRAAILCRSVMPSSFPTPEYDASDCEYMRLLKMLGVPPVSELPRHDTLQNALSGWCAHYGHSHAASQFNSGVVLDYPSIYHLTKLPLVLDNLFSEREKMLICHRCNTAPADAAICLLCGTICCVQSDCCADLEYNERGECNLHMRECGGAIGLFFLVKRCALLYLYANNGTFGQSPYLDAHGELDISMRRGRRQYLHHARWEDVRKIWLNHGIPTAIARKLESSLDSGGWETL